MNFAEHIQAGKELLEKKDKTSLQRALFEFIKADEMADEIEMAKPQTLYYLALINYWIGNIVLSYQLAKRAEKSIDIAIDKSSINFKDMRTNLGENQIIDLISNIKQQFPTLINSISIENVEFNPHEIDFTMLDQMNNFNDQNDSEESSSQDKLSNQLDNAEKLDSYVVNTLTENQKRGILFGLILLAQADGEVHNNETHFLNQTANLLDYDIYDSAFEHFQSLGADKLFETLTTLDSKQKDWFIFTAFGMINADFKTTTEENQIIRVIFENMGITSEMLDDSISRLG
ncbi:tellurite resistance TerB family protein [Olleya aquimaris]|uniref:Tellurite resistance protein TerB n=1 Tax=Olleya aquimaris TaxID=639310 RepID=A0A327R8S5_9FLAO|nr:TerB family tellurite resistance protein [Olleya aquimaris]RAJ13209.1 tellurite resistance protein TerB [Olleya aquimaris]